VASFTTRWDINRIQIRIELSRRAIRDDRD